MMVFDILTYSFVTVIVNLKKRHCQFKDKCSERVYPPTIICVFLFNLYCCCRIKGLSEGQEKLCMLYTDHMIHVGRGARNGETRDTWQYRDT